MITIINEKTITIEDLTFRHADILITDGTDTYEWPVGGLPLEGDLQTILDSREEELLAEASARGRQANELAQYRATTNTRRGEALAFDTMMEMTEAQVRTWIRTNGAEEAFVVIWRVLRFVVAWIRAAERWSEALERLR